MRRESDGAGGSEPSRASSIAGPGRRAQLVLQAALLATAVGGTLGLVHAAHLAGEGGGQLLQWARDALLLLPVALLALVVAAVLVDRTTRWAGLLRGGVLHRWASSLIPSVLLATAMVPLTWVYVFVLSGGPAHHAGEHQLVLAGTPSVASMAAQNAALTLLVALAVLGAVHLVEGRLRSPRIRITPRVLFATAIAPTLCAGLLAAPSAGAQPAVAATAATDPLRCDAASVDRDYDVAAINVHIPYNRWGAGNQAGTVYALQGDKTAIRDWHKPLDATSSKRRLRPRPLVLRANEGECVAVRFTNELNTTQGNGMPNNPRSSIFVRGIPFDVQTSGGSHVGYNDDTTVGIGETVTYYWSAPREGTYFYNDTAISAGSEADAGSLANGLYGAFVVEPAGSTWTDPVSGDALYTETNDQSGELYLDAMITPPTGGSFRETVQLAQDELPHQGGFSFNYGAEKQELREQYKCADCVGEETSLSSWVYGDPGLVKLASGLGPWLPDTPGGEENCGLGTPGFETDSCFTANVTHAYKNDPMKIRYGLAGVRETHIFHLHAHQWLNDPDDVGTAGKNPTRPDPGNKTESATIDSQTFGPMEMFTADLLFGAGSQNGTVGDSIFHCHLYPHFADGFWGLLRTHDVREDGTGQTPDGINVHALQVLPDDLDSPPLPTPDNPGYPRFIPGEFGWRAPQAPLGITRNGVPEPRYVAGRQLQEASPEVQLEQAVMERMSGGESKPGSPFNDPCPTGAREVTYKVSAIQTKLVYNERGDFDSQGRILVLDRDVDAVLSGRKAPEPLFARVNAGDCVNWQLTNRLPNAFGDDAFTQLLQTNMFGQHIHLVKFDVMASDGASNGWNYQQAAFSADQADFNDQIAANPASCTATKCRLDLPADHDPYTSSSDVEPGQTITERWYADYELRTAFTHDHHFAAVDQNRGQYGAVVIEPSGMDFRNPQTGQYYQPVNSAAHAAPCGGSCEGGAVGATMDVIGPGADDDFREFGLAVADFVPLTRGGGNPQNRADAIEPPPLPETFADMDPGTIAINYKNAPLFLRKEKNGVAVDPAYAFSSHVFGDPQTPVLQTYSGDNVRLRMIQGSHEETHTNAIHGIKWQREPDDPGSPWIDAMPIGISEAFNFEVPRLGCATGEDCRGDYLYSSGSSDDLWQGMWGILRVNGGRVPRLLPLPDNVPARAGSVPTQSPTAMAPPPRSGPGNRCPAAAPVREYDVVAMQARIDYNDSGDHDPFGLIYALAEDEQKIRAGQNPEPLVLRAREGECIEVTLHNKLTRSFAQHRGEGDARLPDRTENPVHVPGLRVSLHAGGLLRYDVRGSDGAAVGYNNDQTVGMGKSMLYRWYAEPVSPGELGSVHLSDFGDPVGHRHHGLFAGLVVEPQGASWHDPVTGEPNASGPEADIRVPGRDDFREQVVLFQDGLNLRTADGAFIEDPEEPEQPGEALEIEHLLDAEDSGEKALNYRTEPFRHRLGFEPSAVDSPDGAALAGVFDSHQHGDPSTPVFRAYEGDPVVTRIIHGADKPRQQAFGLAGHSFRTQPHDPESRQVGTLSGITNNTVFNAYMGPANPAGDYLYGSALAAHHLSGGVWGFMRVYPRPSGADALRPTALGPVDDPRAGGHPLLPLELDDVKVTVFHDVNRDGVRTGNEPLVPKTKLAVSQAGRLRADVVSDTEGTAYLSLEPGSYGLQVTPPSGLVVGRAPRTVSTSGDNDRQSIVVTLHDPGPPPPTTAVVRTRVFDDKDRDGRRDSREAAVRGTRVRLLQNGRVRATGLSGAGGIAKFAVAPGAYQLAVTPARGYRLGTAPKRVTTGRAGTVREVNVALRKVVRPRPARLKAFAFFDRDRDGRRDRGEPMVRAVKVRALQGGTVRGVSTTGPGGTAVLRLRAGQTYRLRVNPPRRWVVRKAPVRVKVGKPGSVRTVRVMLRRR